uniref:Uncharacterized protein n=1 Tax=Anguilla anguilla TaxID=7936 RepID=A0A0E9W5N4_ANGAN
MYTYVVLEMTEFWSDGHFLT